MFAFIRSQPDVVARLLLHVEIPSIVDLLVRIIQLDEQHTGTGVLEVSGIVIISCELVVDLWV
jgi:serine/threonine-protein phosphatase 6 regulatory subunit 3